VEMLARWEAKPSRSKSERINLKMGRSPSTREWSTKSIAWRAREE
jgi:ribosomal protein L24E